jgi:hypothetical protein
MYKLRESEVLFWDLPQQPVVLDVNLKLWGLAVGGALRSFRYLSACGELYEGFGGPEGRFVTVPPFVKGCEPVVGVAN